ncbi:site-2 protease family protein [Bacillus mangrovi]|uniref:Site-2 protease family protein n=1 Tax=Metabacillus mangrovi TaxID=1491830 RepID=A0A7X2S5U7_9BACI|nr:site-2 protease family protein [Metabacillus mangrovi]MTH54065.1 site-2 protease family protein [Metabacillus mangrovi]
MRVKGEEYVEDAFSFLAFPLEVLPYVIITLLVAFTVHEFAHAYAAYKFGDPTAKNEGRLTLSPLAHLDPFGTILILLAGFGWAKPVPVNRFYFKNPRLAGVIVSVAGPLSNLLMAFIGIAMFYILQSQAGPMPSGFLQALLDFFRIFYNLNVILFLFNLLPIPPLDGYRIIEDLVPRTIRPKMAKFETYGIIVFIVLFVTPLDQYTIRPFLDNGTYIITSIFNGILIPLF